jgi:CcmD family protein
MWKTWMVTAFALQQTPEGFVPVDQLPAAEQVAAAPLIAAGYAVAWLAIFVYVWTVWRRLGKVEREIADVRSRTPRA